MRTMQPQSKHVVIMMDHGNSLSQTQLHMAKSIAKNLIASFTENDRVSPEICSKTMAEYSGIFLVVGKWKIHVHLLKSHLTIFFEVVRHIIKVYDSAPEKKR